MQGNRMEFLYIPRPHLEEPFVRMLESDEEPRVLNLHSTIDGEPVGGMGKTRLLQRYIEICEERGIQHTGILDFRLTENQNRTALLQFVANELDPDKRVFARYWDIRNQILVARETARRAGKAAWETALRDLEEQADPAWLEGFEQLLRQGKICVFIDTWEAVDGTELDRWLQSILSRLHNCHNLVLVIAGRPPVAWRDIPVKRVEIGPFTLEETQQYAERRGYSGLEAIPSIHQASGGHPVLVAWAFDYGDRGIGIEEIAKECKGDIEMFRRRLVEETHPQLDPTLTWSACLYRRFSAPILKHITGLSLTECQERIQKLMDTYPSIVRRGAEPDSCEPHDEARDMLIEIAWPMIDPAGEEWQRLRNEAIEYYNREIEKVEKEPFNREELPILHAYMAERMFYLFERCAQAESKPDCLREVFTDSFLPGVNRAITLYQLGLAHSLLREAAEFTDGFDSWTKSRYDIARAQLLVREGRIGDALEIYDKVWEEAKAQDDISTVALVWVQMGRCYFLQGQYDQAVDAYDTAARYYQELGDHLGRADALRYKGIACNAHGQWREAMKTHLESGREAQRAADESRDRRGKVEALNRVASAINQAAQVALLNGNTSMARGMAQKALQIWKGTGNSAGQAEAMMTQGRIAEIEGEFQIATSYLEQAIATYGRGVIPSEYGQARAMMFLARVRRRQEQLDEAERMVKDCLETFEQLGRKQQQAFALSEWGTILRDRGYFAEAEAKLREALDIAKDIGDPYRQTEVLEDLVVLARKRGDSPEQVEGLLSQVEELAAKRDYKLFLGRAKEHRGEMAFEAGKYDEAFANFAQACHYLAEYHSNFYRRFLNKVENKLYELPWEEIPKYCDLLIEYWKKQGLGQRYPEMIQRAETARALAQSLLGGGEDVKS